MAWISFCHGVDCLLCTTTATTDAHSHRALALQVWPCQGAFYIIIQLLQCPLSDMDVVTRLITDYKVAVLPGSAFGMTDGCFFRVSFGPLRRDSAAEGLQRLIRGLQEIASTTP